MQMGGYWDLVVNKLTPDQVRQQYPGAIEAFEREHSNDPSYGFDVDEVEFAYDVIPNLGPGGATSDEDDEDMYAEPDDQIDAGPMSSDEVGMTVTGQKDLMFYNADIDELYMWQPQSDRWVLWNY